MEVIKHITIKATVCLSLLLFLFVSAQAQQGIQYSLQYKKVIRLWKEKIEYDKVVYIQENYPKISKKEHQKEDALKAYLRTISEIKQNKSTYLAFINDVIANHQNELSESRGFYTYVDPLLSYFDPGLNIKTVDFFKIVRFSLFEANLDRLPPLGEVPFMNKKEWSPPTYEDFIKANPHLK